MTDQQPDPGTFEGQEGVVPPPAPPQRYQPDSSTPAPPPSTSPVPATPATLPAATGPSTTDRLVAVSGPLSFVLFMVFGFLGGWAWSWIFFMLPGILYAWNRGERRR